MPPWSRSVLWTRNCITSMSIRVRSRPSNRDVLQGKMRSVGVRHRCSICCMTISVCETRSNQWKDKHQDEGLCRGNALVEQNDFWMQKSTHQLHFAVSFFQWQRVKEDLLDGDPLNTLRNDAPKKTNYTDFEAPKNRIFQNKKKIRIEWRRGQKLPQGRLERLLCSLLGHESRRSSLNYFSRWRSRNEGYRVPWKESESEILKW